VKGLPWLLVGGLAVAIVLMRGLDHSDQVVRDALAQRDSLADSLATMAPAYRDALARIEAADAQANRSDTVLVEVVDTVEVMTAQARAMAQGAELTFANATDSLRARSDSVGVRLLDQVVAAHVNRVAADSIRYAALRIQLDSTEASRILWRESSMAKDTALAVQAERFRLAQEINQANDRAIRGLQRQSTAAQVIGAAAMGLAAWQSDQPVVKYGGATLAGAYGVRALVSPFRLPFL